MRNIVPALLAALMLWSASTVAVDITPPPTPSVASVNFVTCTRVRVSWNNVLDTGTAPDPGSGVGYYTVYRRTGKTITELGQTKGGETPHVWNYRRDSFNVPSGTHQFGVSATDNAGNTSATAWSASIDVPGPAATLCSDTKKPNPPTVVTASLNDASCVEATVEWNAGADVPAFPLIPATGVKAYRIYRDGKLLHEIPVTAARIAEDRFGLAPGRHYRYTVTTIDQVGNESLPSPHFDLSTPEECSARTLSGDRAVFVYGVVFADQAIPAYPVTELGALIGDAASPGPIRSYFSESSYGRATFHTAVSTGWWVLPHDTAHYCPGGYCGGHSSEIISDTAAVSGISAGPDDITLIFVRNGVSAQAGLKTVMMSAPATSPSTLTGVIAHEFSHMFRAEHSATWLCPSGLPGPDITDVAFGCANPLGSGDLYSPLTNDLSLRHHPAYTKRVMGFLRADTTLTVTADGIYEIGALEDATENFKDMRLSVFDLADPKFFKPPFYAIEYRTPTGFDGPLGSGGAPFDGLIVRAVPDVSQGLHANTYYLKKILLTPGADIFYDAINDLGLRLLSTDGKVATVRVCGIGSTPCPTDFFD